MDGEIIFLIVIVAVLSYSFGAQQEREKVRQRAKMRATRLPCYWCGHEAKKGEMPALLDHESGLWVHSHEWSHPEDCRRDAKPNPNKPR